MGELLALASGYGFPMVIAIYLLLLVLLWDMVQDSVSVSLSLLNQDSALPVLTEDLPAVLPELIIIEAIPAV